MNRAMFLDRDGVLNELVKRDGGYYSPRVSSSFRIIPESVEITKRTKELGYLNIVISNQPDVARGYMDGSELEKMTRALIDELTIDDVFYCTHDDADLCHCRKPAPGLFNQAADRWEIDLKHSYMIGDTCKDVEAAKNASVECLLLDRTYNADCGDVNRINELEDILNFIRK